MADEETLEQLQIEYDSLENSLKTANTVLHIPKSKLKDGYSMLTYANKILNKEVRASNETVDSLGENMWHYSDSLEPLYVPSKSNAIQILKERKKKTTKAKTKRKSKKKGCGCK